jgi:site-specific recombinase XerD
MAGMRDYTDQELDLVRESFGGRYMLRDRAYFEMSLQLGLRVSEMLSITVGQVYQYGRVVDEVSIDRKHMKGGKTGMLRVRDPKDIDPSTPLFMSRVRNKDGSRRAIARETAWRLIKAIARENELPGRIGTHSSCKTLARKAMQWSNDIRVVQKLLGHRSLASTEAYLKSLTDREVWGAFQAAIVAA